MNEDWKPIRCGGYPQPPEVVAMAADVWDALNGRSDIAGLGERHPSFSRGDKIMRLLNTYAYYKDGGILPPFLAK